MRLTGGQSCPQLARSARCTPGPGQHTAHCQVWCNIWNTQTVAGSQMAVGHGGERGKARKAGQAGGGDPRYPAHHSSAPGTTPTHHHWTAMSFRNCSGVAARPHARPLDQDGCQQNRLQNYGGEFRKNDKSHANFTARHLEVWVKRYEEDEKKFALNFFNFVFPPR